MSVTTTVLPPATARVTLIFFNASPGHDFPDLGYGEPHDRSDWHTIAEENQGLTGTAPVAARGTGRGSHGLWAERRVIVATIVDRFGIRQCRREIDLATVLVSNCRTYKQAP